MKRDTKSLQKAAKELFAHIHESQEFEFSAPDYVGLSDSVYNSLTVDHLDALQTSVIMWQTRKQGGEELSQSDFCALAKDEYENLMPEIHQKRDKPGKKHGKKTHEDMADDDFGSKKSFRR